MRFCWAQYTLWAVIIALATLSMITGCGAKGDLYLPPEEEAPAASQAPASQPQTNTQ